MRVKNLVLTAMLILGMTSVAFAGNIEVKGSTTIFPIMQKWVEAFMKAHPETKISVSGGGSSNGIKAILDGTTDIAMASRKMKDKEITAAKEKNVDAKEIVVALDAVLPIVHPSNPVSDLSIAQLQGIYTGAIKNWKEVGGEDKNIVVISRDTSSGTYETWGHFVIGKGNRVTPAALLQASSGAVLQAVAKNKAAISYDGIGYVNKTVKALKVNGIAGTATTAKSGEFPVSRELQIYTNGEPKGELKSFVDFCLSAEGQKYVSEAGFIPLD
ncbi:MAG: phosphate ABC transporter substrate-binding protein [Desulfovibrionaceae bacterium]|jgi:phosphate transport system substrate-binding protein|nr:phosphate ABC transporter substrate-binding protein [Desulfovibrionaceae bacterium]